MLAWVGYLIFWEEDAAQLMVMAAANVLGWRELALRVFWVLP